MLREAVSWMVRYEVGPVHGVHCHCHAEGACAFSICEAERGRLSIAAGRPVELPVVAPIERTFARPGRG
jgi:hypothetical protein